MYQEVLRLKSGYAEVVADVKSLERVIQELKRDNDALEKEVGELRANSGQFSVGSLRSVVQDGFHRDALADSTSSSQQGECQQQQPSREKAAVPPSNTGKMPPKKVRTHHEANGGEDALELAMKDDLVLPLLNIPDSVFEKIQWCAGEKYYKLNGLRHGNISPLQPVVRHVELEICAEARLYCFAYPSTFQKDDTILDTLDVSEEQRAVVKCFSIVGGFLYFDGYGKLVQAKAIVQSQGPSLVLSYGKAVMWPKELTANLQGRLVNTTIAGASGLKFTWVTHGDPLFAHMGLGSADGGFAYYSEQHGKAWLRTLINERHHRHCPLRRAVSVSICEDDEDSDEKQTHIDNICVQWTNCLADPKKLQDCAASKRSPFKFDLHDSTGRADLNLGVTAVAMLDLGTDFGHLYQDAVNRIQYFWQHYFPTACKLQTAPHMSIGAVILDKKTPQDFNAEIMHSGGLIHKAKMLLDSTDPLPRAKIQALKINPDGCVTFQLEHDPAQDIVVTEAELEERLSNIPTCRGEEAAASERTRFRRNQDGTYVLTRFQQIRLELGKLGCQIKGMFPAGHMVVVNLVDPKAMSDFPREKLCELIDRCYRVWSPLVGQWFELMKPSVLCYVERSLNRGSCVLAPAPGWPIKAYPENCEAAHCMLAGIFTAEPNGDVLIDIERFEARRINRHRGQWQSLYGDLQKLAAKFRDLSSVELKHVFEAVDKNRSGTICISELKDVMELVGEKLTDVELTEMMRWADLDNTGEIDYAEFVTLMQSVHHYAPRSLDNNV